MRGLVDEYAASERQDYIEWGEEEEKNQYEGGSGDKRMKQEPFGHN